MSLDSCITLDDMEIKPCHKITHLGVTFDTCLTWNEQYKSVRNKILFKIRILKQINNCLTLKSRIIYYNSFIRPYFDYCSEIWGESPKTQINKLFLLQKRVIRLIYNVDYLSHTSPLFIDLKILPLPLHFKYCKSVFFYNLINNNLPSYLNDLLEPWPNTNISLRSKDIKNLPVMRVRTSLARNSPINGGVRQWNSLPSNIKLASSLAIFKRLCFNYFFAQIDGV